MSIAAMKVLCGNCRNFHPDAEPLKLPPTTSVLQLGCCRLKRFKNPGAVKPDFAPDSWPSVTVYEKCNEFEPTTGEVKYD